MCLTSFVDVASQQASREPRRDSGRHLGQFALVEPLDIHFKPQKQLVEVVPKGRGLQMLHLRGISEPEGFVKPWSPWRSGRAFVAL